MGDVPLMANTLSRTICLQPTRLLRLATLEPFLQLVSSHVDRGIEVSATLVSRESRAWQ